MAYLYLGLAIVAEVIGTLALKATNGFTALVPSIVVLVGYSAAFVLLSYCLKEMPVGIVYGIWSGLGVVLVSVAGIFIYRQVPDVPAIIGLAMIVGGVVVIHLFSKAGVH